jgi:hypothetical protein
VRAHPNLPAKELVAKARAAGIKLDVGYAYSLRSHDKKSAGKTAKRVTRRAQARNGGSVRRPVANGSAAENLLRAVAAEIGLGRAVEILEAERARVRAAIGG